MTHPPPTKKLKVVLPSDGSNTQCPNFFKDLKIYILEQGIGKTRCNIFKQQIPKYGGTIEGVPTSSTSYILVDKGMKKEKILKHLRLKNLPVDDSSILRVDWLSSCLVSGKLVNSKLFELFPLAEVEKEFEECHSPKRKEFRKEYTEEPNATETVVDEKTLSNKLSFEQLVEFKNKGQESADSDYLSDDEDYHYDHNKGYVDGLVSKERPAGKWVCARPSSSKTINHNEHIAKKLEVLQNTYENTKDKWRAMSYKNAIRSIKDYHKPLETYEEVKNLPFIGDRIAEKIWEIVETGHLRRLDHIDENSELINIFAAVWGAGPSTARLWVSQGYKTLEELGKKTDLTFQQKIGLRHYDDIKEKMPREEVTEIESRIRAVAESVLPGLHMQVCGSYRRGRPKCGDIDVLFSHPDDASRKNFLISVLDKLKETKLVTDDLICVESNEQRKYMGVCRLPKGGAKYRRIDFIVCPFDEWPLALMHFTGSAHFNRSIRLLAKKKNMSLSEHALRKDVIRVGGERVHKGTALPVSCEEDVFKYFGLDYLKPTERDW